MFKVLFKHRVWLQYDSSRLAIIKYFLIAKLSEDGADRQDNVNGKMIGYNQLVNYLIYVN